MLLTVSHVPLLTLGANGFRWPGICTTHDHQVSLAGPSTQMWKLPRPRLPESDRWQLARVSCYLAHLRGGDIHHRKPEPAAFTALAHSRLEVLQMDADHT